MPQVIAGWIASTGIATGVTATVLGYGLYTAATYLALQALAPKGTNSGRGLQTNLREAAAPHDYVYGQVRKGGTVTFLESNGDNNEFLHMIIALAGHEVEEIGDIYINDEIVALDGSGFVTTSDWVAEDSTKTIRIKKHTGADDQIADSDLVSETSVDSNFRGQGVAYIYVRMQYDQDVFTSGIPTFTAVVKGKKVYDPRTASTAYSANAALCVRDYITSAYGVGDSNVDDTYFSAAANTSDEAVALSGGGTEARYEVNGVVRADETPKQILDKMMTTCGGTLYWSGGNWRLRVGEYVSPVKSLSLDDIVSEINVRTRLNRRDSFNAVQGTFVNSDDDYITADYTKIDSATFLAEDNGVENVLDYSLPLTTTNSAAERLAKLLLYRTREQIQFEADFNMNAYDLEVGDVVQITNERYGWTNKEFEVRSWRFFADQDAGDLRVRMVLQETSEAAYDWNAEEGTIISNNSTLPSRTANLTITGLSASGGGSTQGDGTFINSGIISWTASTNAFVDHYEIQWKPTADSNYSSTTTTETSIEISPLIDGVEYTFRVRAVTGAGNSGAFSSVTLTGGGDTTAPALPTSLSANGGLGFIEVAWTNPADADLNQIVVYESDDSVVGNAVEIGRSSGDNFIRGNLGPTVTKYYWVSAVDYSGNESAKAGPVSGTTSQITAADIGDAVIPYEALDTSITNVFDSKVDLSDYQLTVEYQQQLEDATTQLATDALQLALNASSLESRVNDAGITVDPTTGSVTIQGLSAIEDRVSQAEIDLDAAEAAILLRATTTYVDAEIAAAQLPEATVTELENTIARVDTAEIDIDALEGAITLTSTGSLYDVNDGTLGVEALEGRLTVAEGNISLKASQSELDDVETRLNTAEIQLDSIDAPTISLGVKEIRGLSEAQEDLGELTLREVLGRYNDRKFLTQDVAIARQQLTADVTDERTARATLETELGARIDANTASITSEATARADADSAIASDVTTLQADVSDAQSAITEINTVTSTSGSAAAQAIFALESTVDDPTTGLAATRATLINDYYTATESDSAISTAITQNNVTIDNTYATITEVNTLSGDIDSIEAKYGVTIDNNGNATGFQLLSGTGGSAFNIRADQFAVFDSNNNGGSNPFTVFTSPRTVGGVTYPAGTYIENAYIDNAAIVDGSITNAKISDLSADKINAGSLNANYIQIDDVTIDTDGSGNLIIKTGGVDTNQIANSAVTEFESAYTSTNISVGTGSYVLLQSLTIAADGVSPIAITATMESEHVGLDLQIRVGGTTVQTSRVYGELYWNGLFLDSTFTTSTINFVDTPTSGNTTIAIYGKSASGSGVVRRRYLQAVEFKR